MAVYKHVQDKVEKSTEIPVKCSVTQMFFWQCSVPGAPAVHIRRSDYFYKGNCIHSWMEKYGVASSSFTGDRSAADYPSLFNVGSLGNLQMVAVYLVRYVRVCLSWAWLVVVHWAGFPRVEQGGSCCSMCMTQSLIVPLRRDPPWPGSQTRWL